MLYRALVSLQLHEPHQHKSLIGDCTAHSAVAATAPERISVVDYPAHPAVATAAWTVTISLEGTGIPAIATTAP